MPHSHFKLKRQNPNLAVISIVGLIVNSGGLAISNAQATSNEGNNALSEEDKNIQTSDDNNKEQASDNGDNSQSASNDGDDVLSFNQELLPGLSSSGQKIEKYEETPLMANQSGNLQNPSIQTGLNQSIPYSQKDVKLEQFEKSQYCTLIREGGIRLSKLRSL